MATTATLAALDNCKQQNGRQQRYWRRSFAGMALTAILISLALACFVSCSTANSMEETLTPAGRETVGNSPTPSSSSDSCDFTFSRDCEVCGPVDDCLCTVEAVNELNTLHFFPKLQQLVSRPFFKFFYVNLHGECKVWDDNDGLCASPACAVEECEDLGPFAGFETSPTMVSFSDYSCLNLNDINDTVTTGQLHMLQREQRRDALDRSNFCVADEHVYSQEEMQWVNLIDNPERYTGFNGPSARRIWEAVYNSNCFQAQSQDEFYRDFLGAAPTWQHEMEFEPNAANAPSNMALMPLDEEPEQAAFLLPSLVDIDTLCLEERFFYRLLSGVHASISVHLSYKWLDKETGQFRPNITEFRRRFSDSTTGGNGTRWLKNLYFTYLTVLKAIVKAENLWRSYSFSAGDAAEELATKYAVMDLVEQAKLYCDLAIDEEALFQSPDRQEVLEEMRQHLRRITEVMNCVGCMKCRLWGKLQTRGLATAVRLLLGNKIGTDQVAFELGRNDIVALFNLWERLASSITYMHEFQAFPSPVTSAK
eukprot:m.69267 g.69267  ORF g.69267 m.69267 type:complete len:537 (-) comp13727_c0_seq1:515-2125(-)